MRLTENPEARQPVEIRAMVMHPMESDSGSTTSAPIPRHIVTLHLRLWRQAGVS
jgi:hypothetical protein